VQTTIYSLRQTNRLSAKNDRYKTYVSPNTIDYKATDQLMIVTPNQQVVQFNYIVDKHKM